MKIARWGNSLAIRIPADVVRELGLRDGDEVCLTKLDAGNLGISRDLVRQAALEAIRSLRGTLPADFAFDREDTNAR